MKQDHEELIEAMVKALLDSAYRNDASMPTAMRDALRAAQERGYDLVKLPNRSVSYNWMREHSQGWVQGHNDCLDAVEIVRIEGDKG